MEKALLPLLLLLLLYGCLATEEGPAHEGAQEEPVDYSYDLVIKDILTAPQYPRLTENYTVRVLVQAYGRYVPSSYSLWVLDGNETLMREEIEDPGLLEYFEFPSYADGTAPRHLRAEVESTDALHPEPPGNLSNNVMRADVKAYPLGFYDIYNWSYTWFYDAVGAQLKQAQAFTLERSLNISRISVYLQARVPPPPGSKLLVSLHGKPDSWGNIGVGDEIASGEIDAQAIAQKPSWQSIEFEPLELANDTYWIVLEYESPSSAGVEWYRAEGNRFGGVYDTQMLDIAGYGEWEYKGFDFAFRVE